jgi:hypothetical protein
VKNLTIFLPRATNSNKEQQRATKSNKEQAEQAKHPE